MFTRQVLPAVIKEKEKKLSKMVEIRVSHFYTFFELSLVLLTTQAHGKMGTFGKSGRFRTKKMAL